VNDTIDIRIFAIEMAYVPTGAFFAGDNATSTASFRQGSSDTDPWYIGSESAITTGTQAGSGTGIGETNSEYRYVSNSNGGEDTTGSAFTIPSEFPKGYQKFYIMKGEISQSQWVAFFNTLTTTQKSARDVTAASGKNSDNLTARNNVSWTSGDATLPDRGGGATYASVAMNYLSWADLAAYLDWSGLRPMSELEFEKAARGPYRATSGEYAWGTTSIVQSTSISNGGMPNEAPGAAANCVYGNSAGVPGPMRVGAMAAGDATRIESGAGYYGIMDLSGNVWERPVTVGNSTGRGLNGAKHGNGVLTSGGDRDVTTWPGTNAVGAGFRGGAWYSSASHARLSDRNRAAGTDTSRSFSYGGRGVRSAP
jgi:formylglycine-generating enzyme required for sulfatase activity